MPISELQDAKIAILGLGVNNRFLMAYLLRQGCRNITVLDKNEKVREEFENQFPELNFSMVEWDIRQDILSELSRFDVVFRSPAIPYLSPELQSVKDNVRITSQTNLFFELCPAKIIGVTGSKGKGTTCTLIHHILRESYNDGSVYLAGNIGVDPFQFIDSLQPNDLVILEMSSFQLQDLSYSPHISVLLKITPDHLDHHQSLDEYKEAKLNILTHQQPDDYAIICTELPEAENYTKYTKGQVITYKRRESSGLGGWAEGEVIHTRIPDKVDANLDVSGRFIPGEHNLENFIPAVIVGQLMLASPEIIKKAVLSCEGLPHRLRTIGEYYGAQLVDDSIATTPESCAVALRAYEGRRIHLIAGGRDKGQQYDELARDIAKRCSSVSLLPGEATGRLLDALRTFAPDIQIIQPSTEPYFPEILNSLRTMAQRGDVILLSPAAASDAPYYTYVKRAEAFIKAATNEANEKEDNL